MPCPALPSCSPRRQPGIVELDANRSYLQLYARRQAQVDDSHRKREKDAAGGAVSPRKRGRRDGAGAPPSRAQLEPEPSQSSIDFTNVLRRAPAARAAQSPFGRSRAGEEISSRPASRLRDAELDNSFEDVRRRGDEAEAAARRLVRLRPSPPVSRTARDFFRGFTSPADRNRGALLSLPQEI